MNAIIYCRVSTLEQAESGYSLASQEKICVQYANKNGYKVLEVFIEKGESAKSIRRTELKRLLQFISNKKNAVRVIIVYKLDRLSRDLVDYTSLTRLFSELGIEISYGKYRWNSDRKTYE